MTTTDDEFVRWIAALARARRRYDRLWERAERRRWRRWTARKLTDPLAADGSAYHLRSLARRRRQ